MITNKEKFRGIITPLITPFNGDLTIDYSSLPRIIDRAIDGGVRALFVLGTTGEFSSLSFADKVRLILASQKAARGRVPVMAGVSSTDPTEALELCYEAADAGLDAVVATPPHYMKLNQNEIADFYEWLADSCSLPLYVYNIPGLTKTNIEVQTVIRLADHANIVGVKDSSGNLDQFENLAAAFEHTGFDVLIGPEEKLRESLKLKGDGGVNGGSNLFPEWYVGVFQAAEEGNWEEVDRLQNKILSFSEAIYSLDNDPNSYLKGLKAAMSLNGLCQNVLSRPLQAYQGEKLEELNERLKAFV
jgi:4-hydroxy-tetrahydrodipicolinate synthase